MATYLHRITQLYVIVEPPMTHQEHQRDGEQQEPDRLHVVLLLRLVDLHPLGVRSRDYRHFHYLF